MNCNKSYPLIFMVIPLNTQSSLCNACFKINVQTDNFDRHIHCSHSVLAHEYGSCNILK